VEQALGVGGGVRRDHLETWNVRVPGGEVLAVLSRHPRGRTVRATKNHRRSDLAARHVARLSGRIDNLIHGLHGEVEGHELDDRFEAGKSSTNQEAGQAMLNDRSTNRPQSSALMHTTQ